MRARAVYLSLALLCSEAWVALAQVPPDMAPAIRRLGVALDSETMIKTAALYNLLQMQAPKDGVKQTINVKYGPDERHRLDLYEPTSRPAQPMPMLIHIHGGSFMSGDVSFRHEDPAIRTVYKLGHYFDNIGYAFARRGVVTILGTYRLAPQHVWPVGAEDVGAIVRWARENAARLGGDPRRIVLMGHSAGATHAAAYGLMARLQPAGGPGIAGLVVVSGPYAPYLDHECRALFTILDGKCPPGLQAYYGTDQGRYPGQSVLANLDGPPVPVMIVHGEVEHVSTQFQAARLFHLLCDHDKTCPSLLLLRDHNHYSEIFAINTPDESLTRPVLDFMARIAPK